MVKLSMRPYNADLFVFRNVEKYQKKHKELFGFRDEIGAGVNGRMGGGVVDGKKTYIVWADEPHNLAHELSHCILDRFQDVGIDPREANGEPFCYMLSQLMLECAEGWRRGKD